MTVQQIKEKQVQRCTKYFKTKVPQPQILELYTYCTGLGSENRQVSVSYLLLPTQEFHAQTCFTSSKFEQKNLVFF